MLEIIIVNYKTAQLTMACLHSIFQHSADRLEVTVVDNDSGDDVMTTINATFPQVKFIQMGYNSGFARANNEAMKRTSADVVLLLNSDTINRDDAITKCFEKFSNSPHVACGVQLLNEDGTPQISGNFAMTGGLNYLLPLPYLGNLLKWGAGLFKMKKANVAEAGSEEIVDWINGAFLMVKKASIEKAGLLDEDFFLYAEEAEWCSRLKKIGSLCIYGDLHVIHLQGQSANDTFQSTGQGYYNLYDKKGLQIIVSNFLRIRKQFGAGWFIFMLLTYITEIPIFFFGLTLSKFVPAKNQFYTFSKLRGYTKNVFALIGLCPNMIANKPFFYKVL